MRWKRRRSDQGKERVKSGKPHATRKRGCDGMSYSLITRSRCLKTQPSLSTDNSGVHWRTMNAFVVHTKPKLAVRFKMIDTR